ncbi:carbohydrate kinase family protein [Candidatus Venteria ishoeyi]|uniref:Adenosine kinase n=1 Tax=Candidatus Venteria ishoeyi TaxID=1899563 RepID=A0A1H6F9F3_9GAMM|nr:carbohydrate kinase family protein [Candidatus Venteria ishoeyi]MDM8545469.1 carbohydrate kinase family protein [Candidatus Venteria ishoeyi]SEH06727.1 Adenosine kinase [Candidatus Venteria ishoeyi]
MSALVCGSFAFDTIMVFEDKFANHILPEKVHILNVSFMVPSMRREFGGCAGNIAYTLNMLGGDVIPMGTVGKDFGAYGQWMDECSIDRSFVIEIDNTYTAQAFITTDMADNQITAFHPGAMNFSHQNRVNQISGVSMGMVSPDGRDGMIEHAAQFAQADIPFFFDPGQGMPMFDGEDLKRFVEQASWVIVNDYEFQLLSERTGWSAEIIAAKLEALIVTRGSEGSIIYANNQEIEIPSAPVTKINDPTGCGDAYRGGLLYGLQRNLDWATTGRIAALCGAIKIEQHGTQNHQFTLEEFHARFQQAFQYDF